MMSIVDSATASENASLASWDTGGILRTPAYPQDTVPEDTLSQDTRRYPQDTVPEDTAVSCVSTGAAFAAVVLDITAAALPTDRCRASRRGLAAGALAAVCHAAARRAINCGATRPPSSIVAY